MPGPVHSGTAANSANNSSVRPIQWIDLTLLRNPDGDRAGESTLVTRALIEKPIAVCFVFLRVTCTLGVLVDQSCLGRLVKKPEFNGLIQALRARLMMV
jgi:hypothetical protein